MVWMIFEILTPLWFYLSSLSKEILSYNSNDYYPFEQLITKEEFKKIEESLEKKSLIADLTLSYFNGIEFSNVNYKKLTKLASDEEFVSFYFYFNAIEEIRKENYIKAQSFLKESLKLNSNFDFAWNLLGYLQSNARNYKEALDSFKKAVELDPYQPVYRFNLAKTYFLLSENELALKEIEKTLQLRNNLAEAYFIKGILLEDTSKEEALKNYLIALERGLETEDFFFRFLNFAFLQNQPKYISLVLEKINKQKNTNIEILLLQLKIYLHYGEYNKAFETFTKIMSLPYILYEIKKEQIEKEYDIIKILNCSHNFHLQNFLIKQQKVFNEEQINFIKKIMNYKCEQLPKPKDPIVSPQL